jgi:phosphoribosylaminoimidazole carboxylase (NCAIR synthetase)
MMNLLGDLWRNGPPKWDRLLAHPQVRLHLYGKTHAAPGRKMGHFLLIGDNPDQSYQQAEGLLQGMMDAEPQEKDILIKNPATEPFQKQTRPLETPA